ncbi:DUF6495 family protein [soil metagenome]
MKYKRLSIEELKELEKEFVSFLATAQITGGDWEKMKKEEAEKAEELIDVFSDLVYDKVMSKISYLEYRDQKSLNIFHFTENKIVLVGFRVKESSPLNLTADNVFTQWNESNMQSVNAIQTERSYAKDRGEEVFELIQNGCFITDDVLFKTISKLLN